MRLWIKTFRELTTEELYEILRRIPGGRHPARPDEALEYKADATSADRVRKAMPDAPARMEKRLKVRIIPASTASPLAARSRTEAHFPAASSQRRVLAP